MASKDSESKAKENITKKIIELFGQDKTILSDKKLYINTTENGESVQVCLSLTCPKVRVGAEAPVVAKPTFSSGLDFENMGAATVAPEPFKPAEITPSERELALELMRKLNL